MKCYICDVCAQKSTAFQYYMQQQGSLQLGVQFHYYDKRHGLWSSTKHELIITPYIEPQKTPYDRKCFNVKSVFQCTTKWSLCLCSIQYIFDLVFRGSKCPYIRSIHANNSKSMSYENFPFFWWKWESTVSLSCNPLLTVCDFQCNLYTKQGCVIFRRKSIFIYAVGILRKTDSVKCCSPHTTGLTEGMNSNFYRWPYKHHKLVWVSGNAQMSHIKVPNTWPDYYFCEKTLHSSAIKAVLNANREFIENMQTRNDSTGFRDTQHRVFRIDSYRAWSAYWKRVDTVLYTKTVSQLQ